MSQLCTRCQRVNPPEAIYCYFDGALLQTDATSNGKPLNPGAVPFPSPFVFPSGQACQNFDQLATACQNNWDVAKQLLKENVFAGFLGNLGRTDLAQLAAQAARFPDPDRGLDQFLAKLPTQVLQPPKLKVEPSSINLGLVHLGTNRQFELHLENQGMRLVHGTIVSDAKWLSFSETPGQKERLFQFRDETSITVYINGSQLRSSPKPQIARLFIESNAGKTIEIKVQIEVPVKPFPEGVLAGAKSPREIAVKAKNSPKEAAALFESGAVARWFAENGWTYPVQGPAGTGLGAVQQFFEALGLAKPPKVTIDKSKLIFAGSPGQSLHAAVQVETKERRPVYAHATADEAWIDVSDKKVEAKGRIVVINVRIPSVPARPGVTLTAKVRIAANGNQRFVVPVALKVAGTPLPVIPEPSSIPPIVPMEETGITPLTPTMAIPQAPVTAPMPAPVVPQGPAPAAGGADDDFGSFALGAAPVGQTIATAAVPRRRSRQMSKSLGIGTVVAVVAPILLIAGLLTTVVIDAAFAPARRDTQSVAGLPVEPRPRITIRYDYPLPNYPPDLKKELNKTMRFGVLAVLPGQSLEKAKKLTYSEFGQTNDLRIYVDEKNLMSVGERALGQWVAEPKPVDPEADPKNYKGVDFTATWRCGKSPVFLTQIVDRVPGMPFYEDGQWKRARDTCRVRYEIKNRGTRSHSVGLRLMLDTYIGSNDGVPFSVPGHGLVKGKRLLEADQVPDFLQVLENDDLANPGIIVQMNLDIGGGWQPPSRVMLTRLVQAYQKPIIRKWELPLADFNGDSAVVLYWDPVPLKAGETRKLGFSFGLGYQASENGKLGLTVAANKKVGDSLTVLARVGDPKVRTVTLTLPDGLAFEDGSLPKQEVPPLPAGVVGRPREVSWRIKANQAGSFSIEAATDTGERQRTNVFISDRSGIFGS